MRTCPLLFCLVMATAVEAKSPTFMELFKVGQAVTYSQDQDQYSITIYTKKRKLELLAAKQRHDLLYAEEQEITNQIGEATTAEEKVRLAEERNLVKQQRRRLRFVGQFYRVARVGADFVGLAITENQTLIIPERVIKRLTLEGGRACAWR